MKKIALTGNMGTGKSTVAKIFECLQVPVYYSDIEAKKLMNNNSKLKHSIINNFGKEAYKDNKINVKFLSKTVFNNNKKLLLLNSIVHPFVREDFDNWCKMHFDQKYIIMESAIIIETNYYKNFDKIILVSAPLELCIKRIMKRDNLSQNTIKERLKNQLQEEEKTKYANYIIINDETLFLTEQVLKIHKDLIKH